MSAPPDPVSQALSAMDALHNNPAKDVQRAADDWLIAMQKQPIAWQVADQILHRPGLSEQAYFFAAQTLHAKLLFSFNELADAAQRRAFRDSLVGHIARFKTAPRTVRGRLSLCVSCLGVHLLGLGEWDRCIDELISVYGGDSHTALCLLDILAFLPEESNDMQLLMTGPQRLRAQQLMLQATSTIIALLMHFLAASSAPANAAPGQPPQDYISSRILETPNTGPQAVLLPRVGKEQQDMQRKILQCFRSWIKATRHWREMTNVAELHAVASANGGVASLLSSTHLIAHPLLLFCFKLIASRADELEEIAIEVLGSVLKNFTFVAEAQRASAAMGGFQKASELEEGEEEGAFASPQPSPQAAAAQANAPSPYQHMYFMRFMITHILELVPLFDAVPSPAPGQPESEELNVSDGELARCYSRLFMDLGEYYLDFIMEFCIGTAGFGTATHHHANQIEQLQRTMMDHARAAQSKPALLVATPNPQGSPNPASSPQHGQQQPQLSAQDVEALIQSNQSLSMQIVNLVLKCSGHARRSVYSNSLLFWFNLAERLCSKVNYGPARSASNGSNGVVPAVALLSPLQIRQKKKEAFLFVFVSMVPHLHRIMTFPARYRPETTGTPQGVSFEEEDELRRGRHQAADTLLDLEKLIGYEKILDLLCSDAVMGAQYHAFAQNPATNWRELEASLFCIRSLSDRVCEAASYTSSLQAGSAERRFAQGGATNLTLIPKILDLLLDPASPLLQSTQLKRTTLNILGGYAAWIREQGDAMGAGQTSPYLYKALSTVVTCLSDPNVVEAAARNLDKLCEQNREVIANSRNPSYLPNLMVVYKQCCAISVVGSGKNGSGMTLEDQKLIINGVAAVVSCVHTMPQPQTPGQPAPADGLPHYLLEIIRPMVEELQRILTFAQQNGLIPPAGTEQQGAAAVSHPLPPDLAQSLSSTLVRLSETFAKLTPTLNPNKDYFKSVLLEIVQAHLAPLLYTLMQHFADDERRMDKLVRTFKWIIKTTRLAFLQNGLQPLLMALHAAFSRYPHACFLYLLSVCIDYYGAHPGFQPIVMQILPLFLTRSLAAIPTTQAMVHDPDMVEDFFETCTKISKNCPNLLMQLPMLPESQTSTQTMGAQREELREYGLCLHHGDSLSALTHFLSLLLEHGIDKPKVNSDIRFGAPPSPEHVRILQQIMMVHGPEICKQLLLSIGGALPLYRLSMLTGPMEAMLALCGDACQPWLMAGLAHLPDTVDPSKQQFMQQLANIKLYMGSTRPLGDLIYRFGEACRLKSGQA